VKTADGRVEPTLQDASGITSDQVARAQNLDALTLWDVYALAVDRTERLPQRAEGLEQSLARRQQAVGSILPRVSLRGNASLMDGSDDPAKTLALTARQPLLTGLNEVSALKGAPHEVAQRRHEMRHEAGRLLLDVTRSFYSVLQLEESRRANAAIRELTDRQTSELRRRVNLGRSRPSEMLTVKAQLARLEAQLLDVEDRLSQARETLAALSGIGPDQALKEADAPQGVDFPLPRAEEQAETRSDVAAAREAVAVAAAQVLAAQGGHFPTLALDGNYYLHHDGALEDVKWDAGLSMDLPIFSGGSVNGRVREARSRKRQAELALSATRRQARQEIRSAYRSLEAALKEVEAYDKALKAAEENYDVIAREFKLNLVTHLDVLRALSDLEGARDNARRVRYQALVDRVWLGVAVGRLPKTTTEAEKK
jgi:outer membrane protein